MKISQSTVMKRGIDIVLLLALVYVALMALGIVRRGGRMDEGSPAPAFKVRSVWTGKEIRGDSLRGKAVLLDFFSTGCPSCRREIDNVAELQRQGGDKLRVVVISGDSPDELRSYFKRENLNLEVAVDIGGAHRAYAVDTIPYMVVIDPEGAVRGDYIGSVRWSDIEPWLPE